MPPRAAGRRTARVSSREPEQSSTHDAQNTLVRPHLPQLQGTPSSRRQYTYGSGVEPPARVGAGLQRMDLSNAVNQALSRRDDTGVFVRPAKPQKPATTEDEEPSRDDGARLNTLIPRQIVAGSDADSLRSFGMESDYYEDATIGSAPTSTPGPQTRQRSFRPPVRAQQDVPEDRVPRPSSQPRGAPQSRLRQQQLRQSPQYSDEEEEEEEEEDPRTAYGDAKHGKKVNTPAPNRLRQARSNQLQEEAQDEESVDEEETDSERGARPQMQRVKPSRRSREEEPEEPVFELPKPFRQRRPQNRSDKNGIFEPADEINKKVTSFNRATKTPADPRGRGLAIQDEMQEVQDQVAREQEERELRDRPLGDETWGQWFAQQLAWVLSLWPFSLFRRQRRRIDLDDLDEDEHDQDGPVEWWRLLHPMTYLRTLAWLSDRLMDHIFNFIDRVSGSQLEGSQAGSALRWIVLSLFALMAGGFILTLGTSVPSTPNFPDLGPTSSFSWPNPAGLFEKIGSFVPSMPWGSDTDFVWDTPDDRKQQVNSFLEKYKQALSTLAKTGKLHDSAIKKLEAILPRIVHMDLNNGKPVIKQEFWHALRDLMKEDGSFFSFDKSNGHLKIASEEQWKAMLARLAKDPSFKAAINNSNGAGGAEQMESKISSVWDRWMNNNDNKLQQLVQKIMDKKQFAGSEKEFDERLKKLVNEQLKGKNQVVVSREEFLSHVESEFGNHRKQITAQLSELGKKMESRVKEMIQAATSSAPKQMTKTEVATIVQGIVKKALTDMSLQAVAKGKIKVNWDASLKNQVNFFGVGAGATIDVKRTTPVWDPWNNGVASTESYEKGLVGLSPLPPVAALHPWREEGDCWCAARTVNHRGNPHSAHIAVQLAHLVVPQQVVVEHILPGATTDPDARPRQIEVWARIEAEDRSAVQDFSKTHFPDDKDDWNFTPPDFEESFVKISQFVYESSDLQDGVHIHHLSPELEELGARTDHVIVRAVSNYGAATHTCFYRVRLFGKRVDT